MASSFSSFIMKSLFLLETVLMHENLSIFFPLYTNVVDSNLVKSIGTIIISINFNKFTQLTIFIFCIS
jgi:hypothetical protein